MCGTKLKVRHEGPVVQSVENGNKIMIPDLNAAILPNEGAAGIKLGTPIREVLAVSIIVFSAMKTLHKRRMVYKSESVDLWTQDGIVEAIEVYGNYAGKLAGEIGIGTPIRCVDDVLGKVIENEYDDLEIEGLQGINFEIDARLSTSPITHMYIFHSSDWIVLDSDDK
jgi:hypothetical protein